MVFHAAECSKCYIFNAKHVGIADNLTGRQASKTAKQLVSTKEFVLLSPELDTVTNILHEKPSL